MSGKSLMSELCGFHETANVIKVKNLKPMGYFVLWFLNRENYYFFCVMMNGNHKQYM